MKPYKQMKQRRLAMGLTQWQVARQIGFTRAGYANLENGYRRLGPHHLRRIGRALRMRF
jgi:transcriptional regulator with XRE-family HTH domain